MVYTYEVELRVTNSNTKEVQLVTRTEHAYSVLDAIQQAIFNQGALPETGSARVDVTHVGPPAEAIRIATAQLARAIDDVLTSLKTKVK